MDLHEIAGSRKDLNDVVWIIKKWEMESYGFLTI